MERNDRKTNSRAHTITTDRESNFILRKIVLDFSILFIGELFFFDLIICSIVIAMVVRAIYSYVIKIATLFAVYYLPYFRIRHAM